MTKQEIIAIIEEWFGLNLEKEKLSGLPEATSLNGLYTLGINTGNQNVKVPMAILKGERGRAFLFDDLTQEQINALAQVSLDVVNNLKLMSTEEYSPINYPEI